MIKKIKIFDKNYTIIMSKEIKREDKILDGYVDPTKQEIHISSRLNKRDQLSTLIHEVIHSFGYALPIILGEEEVLCMERALMTLFADNKQLIDLIKNINKE